MLWKCLNRNHFNHSYVNTAARRPSSTIPLSEWGPQWPHFYFSPHKCRRLYVFICQDWFLQIHSGIAKGKRQLKGSSHGETLLSLWCLFRLNYCRHDISETELKTMILKVTFTMNPPYLQLCHQTLSVEKNKFYMTHFIIICSSNTIKKFFKNLKSKYITILVNTFLNWKKNISCDFDVNSLFHLHENQR